MLYSNINLVTSILKSLTTKVTDREISAT